MLGSGVWGGKESTLLSMLMMERGFGMLSPVCSVVSSNAMLVKFCFFSVCKPGRLAWWASVLLAVSQMDRSL